MQQFWGRLLTRSEIEQEADFDQVEQLFEKLPAQVEGRCQRCNNAEHFAYLPAQKSFGFVKEQAYCLMCLQMGRLLESDFLYYCPAEKVKKEQAYQLHWKGNLSPQQEQISQELISSSAPIHLVHAVTGAGKTEMIFGVILQTLQKGGRVAVASPRIDVCLELLPRFQAAFPEVTMIFLYGEQEESYRYTPLVLSTTHQMLRFKEAFDLVLVDEIDAFPYADSQELHFGVQRALKSGGRLIYLTATPSRKLLAAGKRGEIEVSILPARYHRHPLVVPRYIWLGLWRESIKKRRKRSAFWRQLQRFINIPGKLLLFMPEIALAEALMAWMKAEDITGWEVVHAKDPARKEKVQALRNGLHKGLVTTSILERGVTFSNCHVFVVGAEEGVYTSAALIQMAGRVGRKAAYPAGHVWFGHYGITPTMDEAVSQIKAMNQLARRGGLLDE